MKVLFITKHYLEDNGGGSFASRAFINAFSELADSSMLLFPDRKCSIENLIQKSCIKIGIIDSRSIFKKVIDIYSGKFHRYSNISSYILDFTPDVIVFDNSICSSGLIKKVKELGIKIITIHHNYEMEYYRGSKNSLFFAWRSVVLHHIKKIERLAVLNSNLNITLTDEDINLLQINYDQNHETKYAKLGCFESETNFISDISEERNDLDQISNLCFAITGSLGTYQTEVSLIPFLENEYPELIKKLPNSTLIIAGSNPSKKLIKTCTNYPSIKLIPNPENMQDILAQADIYICPTCIGGGLKLRIMDGLKAGLPVLSHIVSARGYADFKKENCLFVYENHDNFKLRLDEIIIEKNRGNLNRKKIIKLYNSIFSFESGVDRLRDILIQNSFI